MRGVIRVLLMWFTFEGGSYVTTQAKTSRQFVEPIRNGYGYYRPPYNSLAAALESIARNDELHCVPRLLCELTSGASGKLPFDINGESVLGLLSMTSGRSAMVKFIKAALLGYVSRNGAQSCMDAYDRCPRDPDKLVQYLNNYNGGFFRFFNSQRQFQGRILNNRPRDEPQRYRSHQALKFPIDHSENEVPSRIFPDRTGTGHLKLDTHDSKDDGAFRFPFSD